MCARVCDRKNDLCQREKVIPETQPRSHFSAVWFPWTPSEVQRGDGRL